MRFLLYNIRYAAGIGKKFHLPLPYSGYLKKTENQLIKKIPNPYQNAIYSHIGMLESFPDLESLDILPLTNHTYDYRIRIGRYRVLFNDDEQIQIIEIREVKKRDGRTY